MPHGVVFLPVLSELPVMADVGLCSQMPELAQPRLPVPQWPLAQVLAPSQPARRQEGHHRAPQPL